MRPARMRRKVDLPEPDLPGMATISPSCRRKSMRSSTRRPARSGVLKLFETASAAIRLSGMMTSIHAQTLGGKIVEAPPEQPVEQDDIEAENRDAERDALRIAGLRPLRDIGADPRRLIG